MRITEAERRALFGSPGSPAHRVLVTTPWGIDVWCHRLVATRFLRACRLAASASTWRPRRIDSYANRPIRGSTVTSLHAWALAWDFFSATRPDDVWGPTFAPPESFARSFEVNGFEWGGRWRTRRDYPHIEWSGPPPTTAARRATVIMVKPTDEQTVYLLFGRGDYVPIEDPTDRDVLAAAGIPLIEISAATWSVWKSNWR